MYQNNKSMKAIVSVVMGSISDLSLVKKTVDFLDQLEIPFEIQVLSAHRTPDEVGNFAKNAKARGIEVIIAAAGMAAHLPGVIASMTTTIPVIGIPISTTLEGIDALLSIVQMPPGIPVATVGINGAVNAAVLATQILSLKDVSIQKKLIEYKESLKVKVMKTNCNLITLNHRFKTN